MMVWLFRKNSIIGTEQGRSFDSGMLYFWIPLHLVALFALYHAFRRRLEKKAALDRFSGKRR